MSYARATCHFLQNIVQALSLLTTFLLPFAYLEFPKFPSLPGIRCILQILVQKSPPLKAFSIPLDKIGLYFSYTHNDYMLHSFVMYFPYLSPLLNKVLSIIISLAQGLMHRVFSKYWLDKLGKLSIFGTYVREAFYLVLDKLHDFLFTRERIPVCWHI